jgi:DNA-binding NtrC family response regulator
LKYLQGGLVLANDLNIAELIEFSEGNINLQGRRLVIHDLGAFAELRKDLIVMLGTAQARRILTRFGYWWGKADAAAMKRVFTWKSLDEFVNAGCRLQSISGMARTIIKGLRIGANGTEFEMEVQWHGSAEAEEWRTADGAAAMPSCWILTSYASGFVSFCLDRDIYFIEERCRCKGDKVCTAVGKEKAAWGDQILPHLPFFELDDIQKRIESLSEELTTASAKLEAQRKKATDHVQASSAMLPRLSSNAYLRILDIAERVAQYDSSLLITGETGTGKEILSRHVHKCSPRAGAVFLPINCGALPETLLESELFGHAAGAFTGATRERAGIFEAANNGTVFLDEIGDISAELQLKLLRVLQEREVVRLGENKARKIDVRIIAATNRDLPQLIREGRFREDLFYRLAVIEIAIPPLRERLEDILPLARHFVKSLSRKFHLPGLRLDASCLDYLQSYPWPGNVRELENTIERAAQLCTAETIRPENLPSKVIQPDPHHTIAGLETAVSLATAEMRHIESVLALTNGNQRQACKILGIGQATLWRKLKKKG